MITHQLFFVIEVHFPAQFDDTIRDSFPDLVMSLKDNNGKVWSNGASIIGKLAEHGV